MQEPGDSGGRRAQRPGQSMNWIQIPGIVGHSLLPTRLAPEVGCFCSAVFMPILRNVYGGQSSPSTFTLALTQTKGRGPQRGANGQHFEVQDANSKGYWFAFCTKHTHLTCLVVALAHRYLISTALLSPSKDSNLPLLWQAHQGAKGSPKGALFSSVLFIVSFKHDLWSIHYVPHSLPSTRNTIVN